MRRVIVGGDPIPQGSTKAFAVKGRAFTTSTNAGPLARYRNDIRHTWSTQPLRRGDERRDPVSGPVCVTVIFGFKRPKDHFNAKGQLKDTSYAKPAPQWVEKKPDVDKLLRAVLDALTGYAYDDDDQVVQVIGTKMWADQQSFTDIIVEDKPHGYIQA